MPPACTVLTRGARPATPVCHPARMDEHDEHDEHEQQAAAAEPDDDAITGEVPPVGEYRLSTR